MCEHSVTMSSQMAICCLATLVGNDFEENQFYAWNQSQIEIKRGFIYFGELFTHEFVPFGFDFQQ